jgi:Tfp pilus assembly protein PilF
MVGAFAYAPSFKGLFVLDEDSAIVKNPNIRSLRTAFTAPPEVGLGGRPVSSLSFALNYALAPEDAREAFTPPPPGYPASAWDALYRNLWGYHAANLAIHLLAALAVFGIARRTFALPRLARFTGAVAVPLALGVALVWVTHPLHTGCVTYVAQRVESMMGMFYLAALYFAVRAGELTPIDGDAPDGARGRAWWVAASVVACALGQGTKEVTVTLPFVVLIYDAVFLYPPPATLATIWVRRWPLYAGLGATWVLLAAFVMSASHTTSVGTGLGWTPWLYLQTQAGIIVHYLRLAVVPWPLVLDYEWPPVQGLSEVLPYAIPLLIAAILSAWGVVKRHPLGFVGAWCFLILAPSSSVLPIVTEVAAEHRMYLPLAALLAAVAAGGWLAVRRVDGTARTWTPPAIALVVVAVAAVVACTTLTRARNVQYQDEEGLWKDTITKRPENSRALGNLAVLMLKQGRTAEAEPLLVRALAVRPDYPEAQSAMGAALAMQGRVDDALPHFARAVALRPDYVDAWANYAEALASRGQFTDAVAAFRKVITLKADSPRALTLLSWILATSKSDGLRDGAAALDLARRAVELTGSRDPNALDSAAAALATLGRFSEADAAAARAADAARAAGQGPLAQDIDRRRALYASGQPYRE